MEIYFLLILQDEDGVSHHQKPTTFTDETTVKELSKAINSFWCFPQDFQELYHDGKQILSLKSTLEQIGVKDDDEIVIKHSHLGHWNAYLNRVQAFKDAQVNETRKSSAENAQRFYDLLLGSSFFLIYPKFDIAVIEHHKPISKYLDKHSSDTECC